MKKIVTIIGLIFLFSVSLIGFSGCGKKFTVTFVTNGGTAIDSVKVQEENLVTEPFTPTKDGYQFEGWYSYSTLNYYYNFSSIVLSDITLYADWGTAGLEYTMNTNGTTYSASKGTITDVSEIVIPKRHSGLLVTGISESGFTSLSESVKTVLLPNSLLAIGENAFNECSSLESIIIPSSVLSIGENAFNECYYANIYAKSSTKPYNWASNWNPNNLQVIWGYLSSGENATFKYVIFTGNKVAITGLKVSQSTINIPSTIDGKQVTIIGNSALISGTDITSITLPSSLTEIGPNAFLGTDITSLSIPSNVTSIRASAFVGCVNLTSIIIPNGVTAIEDYLFSGCTSLSSITLPSELTSIGEHAFDYCSSLTNITIPTTVISIRKFAFLNSGLTSISIPGSVAIISESAFSGCSDLVDVVLGYGTTTIGKEAFRGCGFTSINIRSSITTIEQYAFSNCYNLSSIAIPINVTTIGYYAFDNCRASLVINAATTFKPVGWDNLWNPDGYQVIWEDDNGGALEQ